MPLLWCIEISEKSIFQYHQILFFSFLDPSVAYQNLYPWQAGLLLFMEEDQRGPH